MKKFLNNIKDEASALRMTRAEKSAMLARVLGAPSPLVVRKSPYVFLSYFSHEVRMVMAGFTLFIFAGFSTVSAAQGSLPGDLLYPVKLSINEKVEMALASDTSAKAALEARLAERRVEEAQTLAAEGRLDAAVAESLAVNFEAHAENAQNLADASEEAEPGISAQVKTRLSASLAVHGAVLKTLGKESSNDDTKEQSDTFGDRIIARAEGPQVAMNTRAFAAIAPAADSASLKSAGGTTADAGIEVMSLSVLSDAPAPTEEPGSEKRAARLQKKAAESLHDARELFDEALRKMDAATTAKVEKSFAEANRYMSAGAEALGSGSFTLAQEQFTAALQISGKLEALLKAEKRFDNGILRALIRTEIPESGDVRSAALDLPIPQTDTPPPAAEEEVHADSPENVESEVSLQPLIRVER